MAKKGRTTQKRIPSTPSKTYMAGKSGKTSVRKKTRKSDLARKKKK